ncbi:MAG: hypothetical protein ACRDHL_14870, partial [Candidatus Promineifilaceae bacterium]
MKRALLPAAAGLALLLALLPPTLSPYQLTGEEEPAGQLRGLWQWAFSAVRPQPRLAAEVPLSEASLSPFGMNTFLQLEVLPEVRAETLRLLSAAGFGYIRQEFPWEDIEIHAKGDFRDRRDPANGPAGIDAWAKYDNIVALAEQHDITIVARLSNPPAWSRAAGDALGSKAPPDDFEDYGDFVAAVVGRYRGRLTYFQLWNEPNIYDEWGEQPVDPEAFTRLLCTGYRRAKEANPAAVVLAGALAPTIALDGRNLNDLIFLQRMYRASAGDCFDILSAQGYGLFSGPTDRRLRPLVINYPHLLYIRDLMVAFGDAHKPLWISEMGWNSAPAGLPEIFGRVTEDQQARYAVEGFRRAQAEWPWASLINYWFLKRPGDGERDQPFYYFRVMEPDFTPLPAWEALAAYAGSPEAAAVAPRPAWLSAWDSLRPWLALLGGAALFFWLLGRL